MTVRWTRAATRDLRAIENYIATDSQWYARAFVERVLVATRRLSVHPHSGRRVPESGRDDVREVLYGEYRVIYRLVQADVHVLAVVHGRRDLTRAGVLPEST